MKRVKILGASLIGLFIIGTPLLFAWQTDAESTEKRFSLICHNTAGINTNPIEYASQLEMLAEGSDPMLCRQAHTLLAVNKSTALSLKIVTVGDILHSAYIKIAETVCQAIHCDAQPSKIIENFTKKYKDVYLNGFLYKNKFSHIDKALRAMDKTLPSPIFCNQGFVNGFSEKNEKLLEAYIELWISAIKPYLPELYNKSRLSPEDFSKAIISYFLFTVCTLHNLTIKKDGIQAWVEVAEAFKKAQAAKPAMLANSYQAKSPTWISLQEAHKNVVSELCKNNDYQLAEDDKRSPEGEGEFGSVNLYKKSYLEKNHYKLTTMYFDAQTVGRYSEGVKAEKLKRLFTKEVCINKLESAQRIIVHICFHADSKGDNTIAFLQASFALKNQIEQSTDKPVYMIMCLDGNFTIKGTKDKRDLAEARPLIQDAGCKIVTQKGQDVNTTNKERSHMQVQLDKAGKKAQELSDIIIVSNNISIDDTWMAPYTQLSDHRAIGASIALGE